MSDSKHLLSGEKVESLSFPTIETQSPAEMEKCENVWDVTHEQMRQLRLPTAEEIQKIREMARKEGHKAGYAAGEKTALTAGKKRIDTAVKQLNTVLNQLAHPLAEQADRTSEQITEIVCLALKSLLQRELLIDSSGVASVVQEAVAAVEQGATRVNVRVNPQDLSYWQEDSSCTPPLDERVTLKGDKQIKPGGCVVETTACQVDGTVESRLSQVIDGLYEALANSGQE